MAESNKRMHATRDTTDVINLQLAGGRVMRGVRCGFRFLGGVAMMNTYKSSALLAACIWSSLLLTGLAQPAGAQSSGSHSEFKVFEWDDVVSGLDNFFPELGSKPDAEWHIIVYGGQDRRRGEAEALAACVKDHVFNRRGLVFGRYGVSPKQVKVILGGYRENVWLELWLVPRGERVPSVNPTVQAQDIRFRGRMKGWRGLCKP
jgi:hypothetical protein